MDIKNSLKKIKQDNQKIGMVWGWLEQNRKYWPLASFALGFTWDNLTLPSIDSPFAYVQLIVYWVIMVVVSSWLHLAKKEMLEHKYLIKYQHLFPLIIQFVFGGLFSAMAIYYFQSAAFSQNLIFVFLLLALTLSSEFLDDGLTNPYLQFSLQYLVTASLLAFMLPMLFNILAPWTFLGACIFALVLLFAQLGYYHILELMPKPEQAKHVAGLIPLLALGFYLLYLFNLIPPVPLALKDTGVYHKLEVKKGKYLLHYEPTPWYIFWREVGEPFHFAKGDSVIVFTPIFAPKLLRAYVYHHWYLWHPTKREWVKKDTIGFQISGGRQGGHRSFTKKRRIAPGDWKVDVRTDDGRLLGSVPFHVVYIKVKKTNLKVHIY